MSRSSSAVSTRAEAPPIALPIGSTAVVYCEANFGELDGKTANGLVRHSETLHDPQRDRQPPRRPRRR